MCICKCLAEAILSLVFRAPPLYCRRLSGLKWARRHIAPGDGDNNLPSHKVADTPGGVQDARPSVNSGFDPALHSTGHSTIRHIRKDRPKSTDSMIVMNVETTADPSTTTPVVGMKGAAARGDDKALAALAGVSYREQKQHEYGQKPEQQLKGAPTQPTTVAVTPAQLSVKGQVDQPQADNMLDQGLEQELKAGMIHKDKREWGENQQQGRSEELQLVQQPQGEHLHEEKEQDKEKEMRQKQHEQIQQHERQQPQQYPKERQRQQQRKPAPSGVHSELKTTIEAIQDQRVEQERGHQMHQQPHINVQVEQDHLALDTEGVEHAHGHAGLPSPSRAENKYSSPLHEPFPQGAAAVWSSLLEASSLGGECLNPPCGKVRSVRYSHACCR